MTAATVRLKVAGVRGRLRALASRGRIRGDRFALGARSVLSFAGQGTLSCGRGVVISPDFQGFFSGPVRIGSDVFVNRGCHFVVMAGLEIGDGVRFGERVSIHDEAHVYEPVSEAAKHRDAYRSTAIFIGERAWIGANVVILQGVRIGCDAVVAAGAVVRHDVPDAVLAAGVPAVTVRELAP